MIHTDSMANVRGGMRPPEVANLSLAEDVIAATSRSGTLYRDGLGMIASENIVSPMVQQVISSDLHGRYAELFATSTPAWNR